MSCHVALGLMSHTCIMVIEPEVVSALKNPPAPSVSVESAPSSMMLAASFWASAKASRHIASPISSLITDF